MEDIKIVNGIKLGALDTTDDELIVDRFIDDYLKRNPSLSEELKMILMDEKIYRSCRVNLYKLVNDHLECQTCKGLHFCHKAGRKGMKYRIYLDSSGTNDLVNFRCQFSADELTRYQNLLYTNVEKGSISRYFDLIYTEKSKLNASRSEFVSTIARIMKRIDALNKDHSNGGLVIKSPNNNKDVLALFAAGLALKNKLKTVLIDAAKLGLHFTNSAPSEEINEILAKAQSAQILILLNVDGLIKRSNALDFFLAPFFRLSVSQGKLGIITSREELDEALDFGVYAKVVSKKLKTMIGDNFQEVEVIEPSLFD